MGLFKESFPILGSGSSNSGITNLINSIGIRENHEKPTAGPGSEPEEEECCHRSIDVYGKCQECGIKMS
jgi:hypothetical protein